MNRSRPESKTVRLLYMVIFTIIMIIVLLFIVISTRMNDQYEETMAYAIENVTHRSVLEVRSYFEPIVLVDALLTEFWSPRENFEFQALRIEPFARRLVALYPQINNIYFGSEDGDFVLYFVNELGSGSIDTKISIREKETTMIRRFDGHQVIEIQRNPLEEFDPRTRPWYLGSKEQHDLYLTDPYVFYTSQQLGTSVSRGIENDYGFWGSYGIDVTLDDLKDMLSKINIMRNGEAFIQMPNGAIITSNTNSFHGIDDYNVYIDPDQYGQPIFTDEGFLFVSMPISDVFQSDMILGIVLDYHIFSRRLALSSLIIRIAFVLLFINLMLFVSVRLMNKNSKKQLFEIATLDQLTGLKNRHTFEDVYKEMQEQFTDDNQIFSIALADIDYFKLINDTHGHSVGDEILIELARLIESELRDDDIVFRWGGEEFLILFGKSNLQQSIVICERLRAKIEDHVFLLNDLNIKCTISFGVTEHHDLVEKNTLIKKADDRLYEAKNSGRNQVRS